MHMNNHSLFQGLIRTVKLNESFENDGGIKFI